MIETAGEREQSAKQLWELTHQNERAKRDEEDSNDGVGERQESDRLHLVSRREAERAQ